MQKIECTNCGSNNLTIELQHYKCNYCHTKFKVSDFEDIKPKRKYKYISFLSVVIVFLITYTLIIFNVEKAHSNLAEIQTPLSVIVPKSKTTSNILNIVTSSNGFTVVLDQGNIIDTIGYSGKKDPLGTLHYGSAYKVLYNINFKEWIVTGFHEKRQKVGTYIYSNANPLEYKMSLWGRKFSFDEEGDVYDKEFGRIGRIVSK